MKKIIVFAFLIINSLLFSSIYAAEETPRVVVIPLSSTKLPETETLVSASGVWSSAGMTIPSMIVKDLFFYVNSDTTPPCDFTMNFVIDQFTSRTIRRFSLSVDSSVQVQFGAGVNASDLRFGTIGGGTCVRHWAAFGIQIP